MAQYERIPPQSEEAERSVLGAILMDPEVLFDVSEILTPEDFYSKANQEIYSCMLDLYRNSEAVDVLTVTNDLIRRKTLESVGGRVYVAMLSTSVPTVANVVQYARIVAEKSMLRKIISAAGTMTEESFNEELDSSQVLDHAERSILDIAKARQSSDFTEIKTVISANLDIIHERQKNGGELPGLKTGFTDLDNILNGLQNSDMVIVGARPSMGKTAFALNIAQYAAVREGKRVAIFSLEMPKELIGMRLLAMEARVDSYKLMRGDLDAEDWESINMASEALSKADILINDSSSITVMEIRNKCRRMTAQKHLDLIVIDYIGLIATDGRSENRQQEVAALARYLKQLAREMECPVIVLSQLSRGNTGRPDKRPMLSDLRESGAIEQDADVVMFLHREDYYKSADKEKDNICEVIIAKQRNGETGSVYLSWLPKYTKFANNAKKIEADFEAQDVTAVW